MHSKWFKSVSGEFCTRFEEYKGKPTNYVEIGCWEGASASWVCKHVLTHAKSKGIGIDPYTACRRRDQATMDQVKSNAARNLSRYGDKWSWIYRDSKMALRRWRLDIDVLYIDGLHEGHYALQDFVLAFPYLRQGATVIFDDFRIGHKKRFPHVPETIAAILIAFDGLVEPCQNNERQYALKVLHKHSTPDWFSLVKNTGTHDRAFGPELIKVLEAKHAERAAIA